MAVIQIDLGYEAPLAWMNLLEVLRIREQDLDAPSDVGGVMGIVACH